MPPKGGAAGKRDHERMRVLILGAGYAGLSVASQLNKWLSNQGKEFQGRVQVALVDRNHSLILDVSYQFVLAGRSQATQLASPYNELLFKHVYFFHDEVVYINLKEKTAIGRGHNFRYDILVLAMGAAYDPLAIEGAAEGAFSVGSLSAITQLKEALRDFEGGKIVVANSQPNPKSVFMTTQFALLIQSLLVAKKKADESKMPDERSKVFNARIILTTPDATPPPFENSRSMARVLQEKGVEFKPNYTPVYVDPVNRGIIYDNGEKIDYNLLVMQFPHKAPKALIKSGLTNAQGFVNSNALTLRTEWPNIYCLGDCANLTVKDGRALAKSGAFSDAQGQVVANDIIKSVEDWYKNGVETKWDPNRVLDVKWDPKKGTKQKDVVGVLVETGDNEVIKVEYDYFTDPNEPTVDQEGPNRGFLDELIKWWESVLNASFKAPE